MKLPVKKKSGQKEECLPTFIAIISKQETDTPLFFCSFSSSYWIG